MMHRCSNMVGPCTCGLFHGQSNVNSFSMLFSMPKSDPSDHYYYNNNNNNSHHYPSPCPSTSVDCTLSLGTPSTRVSSDEDDHRRDRRSSVSNFCWDILQPKTSPSAPHSHKPSRGGPADPLLARRCANCDTTSTPLWRNGPRGPKSLCNACGIRFKKEERRASAAAASGGSGGGMTEQQQHHMYNTSWSHQTQKMPCYSPAGNEFRFVDDVDGRDSFLSWRLNVTDRPGLVHDFTR